MGIKYRYLFFIVYFLASLGFASALFGVELFVVVGFTVDDFDVVAFFVAMSDVVKRSSSDPSDFAPAVLLSVDKGVLVVVVVLGVVGVVRFLTSALPVAFAVVVVVLAAARVVEDVVLGVPYNLEYTSPDLSRVILG